MNAHHWPAWKAFSVIRRSRNPKGPARSTLYEKSGLARRHTAVLAHMRYAFKTLVYSPSRVAFRLLCKPGIHAMHLNPANSRPTDKRTPRRCIRSDLRR